MSDGRNRGHVIGDRNSQAELDKVKEITQQWRLRLSDLSWFMRSLNEYIARKANEEDSCKGHFWESRFKSQALLDEQALLSCMAYVDLNPIRAGIIDTLEESEFTSIQQRIVEYSKQQSKNTKVVPKSDESSRAIKLTRFCNDSKSSSEEHDPGILYSLKDYFELTDWTGRAIRDDKRGSISEKEPKLLLKLGIDSELWLDNVKQYSEHHKNFIGSESQLKNVCEKIGKKWLFGIKQSRLLYKNKGLQ